ncbi:hypothetical protein K1719_016304 [Acacia pycnantha]|nr:hypothetical protein K1719_016304 [Acacia pycnantha]
MMKLTMKSMGYQSKRVQASDSHQQNFHEAGITKWRLLRGAKIGSISHGETLSGLWIDAGPSHWNVSEKDDRKRHMQRWP